MVYFLIPFKSNAMHNPNHTFKNAVKDSLIHYVCHKKATLAYCMLILTLLGIWWFYKDLELYNTAHGGGPLEIDFSRKSAYYMVGVILFTITIYLGLVLGRTRELQKKD